MADSSWLSEIPWGQIAGAVSQAGGSIAGQNSVTAGARGQSDIAQQIWLRALGLMDGGQLGYTPAQAEGIQRPVGDQGAMAAQQDALYKLQEAARAGYSTTDRAAINAAVNQANQNAKSQREAILARMDPRSGAALAAQMQAQQGSANQASQQAMDIAAGSRAKALAALGQYGNLAGHMRDQEYGERSAIDQFNANVGRFNVGQVNDARSRRVGNQLEAFRIGSGAGKDYGNTLANVGLQEGRGNVATGEAIGSGFKLWDEYNRKKNSQPSTNSSPATNSNTGVTPDNGTDPYNPPPYYIRDPEYDR